MIDPHANPNDRTDPPAADEDATETSGAGYGNHPDEPSDQQTEQ